MEKSYDKYYVKRDPSNGMIIQEGNEPILGECAKSDCRLTPRHATILNKGWKNSGVYFKEVIKEVIEPVAEEGDVRLALEVSAKELGISFRADISDEKLKERINAAKK
jgi:hypothetical protein